MDCLVPGVSPSGKRVETGVVGIITFENGKVASERLYWDHASVLPPLRILDSSKAAVKGNESPRTLLQWAAVKPVQP
jgi:carboxymethylenebutenolidase